jgi:hypothetical protein
MSIRPSRKALRRLGEHLLTGSGRRDSSPPASGTVPVETITDAIETLRATPISVIQELGYHFHPNDYYSPLNDRRFLDENPDLWEIAVEPSDVELHLEDQLTVAREVATHVHELADVPDGPGEPHVYCWDNGFWNNADALVQYGLVRSRRPARIIEIGCGWSSLLLARAVERNERETGDRPEVVQIEPYPRREVLRGVPDHWRLIPVILQRAPLELFRSLRANDILFYDGSHCAKVGSDVTWFFFRVLPLIAPGVLIHLHDIFFPYEYPREWIFERGQSWNEQYILYAFLMNNNDYRVLIANRYLHAKHEKELDDLYQGIQPSYGCSFWMEKLARSK